MIIRTQILGEHTDEIKTAAKIIKEGGLVAFPTETVYGLGANALSDVAVKKVYEAKGRPSDNPMIVHISSQENLKSLTYEITDDVQKIIDNFWPGPLTVVVKAKGIVPKVTTGGLDTVAVRMPSNLIARKLIEMAECPIAAPSANLSGRPSPTKVSHVMEDLYGKIDAIIDSGDCTVGIESTVLDMTGTVPMILRPGIITKEEIERVLGKEVFLDPTLLIKHIDEKGEYKNSLKGATFRPKAPGMKYKHYAPKAEMILYKGEKQAVSLAMAEEKFKRVAIGQKVEVIIYDEERPEIAAHDFFAKLRACDKKDVDVILVAALKEEGIGFAVMNRMVKSAGYNIVEVE